MALRELIETLARALVDHPDEVRVEEVQGHHNLILELYVAPSDIGKVIGREGRTAQAMRTVLSAAASKMGQRVHLDIVD